MSARTLIVVVLALVCGLCAALGIQGMRRSPSVAAAPPPEPVETESVVFAKEEIKRGDKLLAASIELKKLPKSFIPVGALTKESDAVERVAQVGLPKGGVVTASMLVQGSISPLAGRVPKGMRAVTILSPTAQTSLAGSLSKDDLVDILATRGGQNGPLGNPYAAVLLQKIKVLGVFPKDENLLAEKAAAGEVLSVTLLVDPEAATILEAAQATGTIHIALRNPEDDEVSPPLANPPAPRPLARKFGAGWRAITIPTPNLSASLAGFLRPRDYVDVLKSKKNPNSTAGRAVPTSVEATPDDPGLSGTRLILEGAEVVAVHTKTEPPTNGQFDPKEVESVTLLVRPEDALKLDGGHDDETYVLALRSSEESIEARPFSVAGPPPAPVVPAPPMPASPPTPTFRDTTRRTRTLRGTAVGADRMSTRSVTAVIGEGVDPSAPGG